MDKEVLDLLILNWNVLVRRVERVEDSLFQETSEREVNLGRLHILWEYVSAHILNNFSTDYAKLDVVELNERRIWDTHELRELASW